MKVIAAVAGILILTGCAGVPSRYEGASFPSDYRELIARNRSTLFKDPASVRDAMIGTPKTSMWGWQVCLKANAKNGFGGYTGQNMYTVQIYKNGNPPILMETTIYDGCGSDSFASFHEIEGDYAPPAPAAAPGPPSAAPPASKPKKLVAAKPVT